MHQLKSTEPGNCPTLFWNKNFHSIIVKCFQLISFVIHYSLQKWFSLANWWPFVSYWCHYFSDYTFLPIRKIILILGILNSFVIYMWMFRLSIFSCKVQLIIITVRHHFFFWNIWSQAMISISVENQFHDMKTIQSSNKCTL